MVMRTANGSVGGGDLTPYFLTGKTFPANAPLNITGLTARPRFICLTDSSNRVWINVKNGAVVDNKLVVYKSDGSIESGGELDLTITDTGFSTVQMWGSVNLNFNNNSFYLA